MIGRLFLTWGTKNLQSTSSSRLTLQVDNSALISICIFIPQGVLFSFHLPRKLRPKLPSSIPIYVETWRGAVRSSFVESSRQRSDLSFAPRRQTQLVASGQTRPRYAVVGQSIKYRAHKRVDGTNLSNFCSHGHFGSFRLLNIPAE